MRYVIHGIPIPLQRVRFVNRHCWDSQKELKTKIAIEIESQHNNQQRYSGAVKLLIDFHFPFPQSMSLKKQIALQSKSHVFRPDLSNLIKFIEDVAIGILYNDDSIIAEIVARKCYDAQPRTEFEIIQLER
jgi:Holliday junction resolvase RusA-like endonuclease